MHDSLHPLDRATALRPTGDAFHGRTQPEYGNMVGPYGGITAATLMRAVLEHPARLGDPVALTVNYAAALTEGDFVVSARAARTNRSTQHWTLSMQQDGQVATTGSALFALRRETWAACERTPPAVPPAAEVPVSEPFGKVAWTRCYEMRFVDGGYPAPGSAGGTSTSTLWIRDLPPRPLDFVALTAICDNFYPRIYLRRPRFTPAGTVSMTIYFHADTETLRRQGSEPLLAQARALNFVRGYFDQTAEIWSADGVLLASTHQIVYFKD